jgi:hypothetical protein
MCIINDFAGLALKFWKGRLDKVHSLVLPHQKTDCQTLFLTSYKPNCEILLSLFMGIITKLHIICHIYNAIFQIYYTIHMRLSKNPKAIDLGLVSSWYYYMWISIKSNIWTFSTVFIVVITPTVLSLPDEIGYPVKVDRKPNRKNGN